MSDHMIPDHAEKMFSGVLFDVYQWDQKLHDGSKARFEMVRRIPSVQIIAVTPEGKIILLKEDQPHIGSFVNVPGGQGKHDENPEETARKELLEELGMKADEMVLWRKRPMGPHIDWPIYYFIARNCRKVKDSQPDAGEKIEPFEVTFEEFFNEVEKDEFRNFNLREMIFRIKHNSEAEDFKRMVFGD